MAGSREQQLAWQRQIAPGSGIRARLDRGAWSAAGQREPWLFSWPRALLQMTMVLLGFVAVVVLLDVQVTTLIGGTLGYAALIWRAHHLHREFVRKHPDAR